MSDSTTTSSTPSETSPKSETSEQYWATIDVGSTSWDLVVSDSKTQSELEGLQGYCDRAKQKLFVNRDETPHAGYKFVAFHEIFHAATWTGGHVAGLQEIIGCDDAKMEKIEEYIVTTWGQAMFDTLSRNGMLSFPSPPVPLL